MISACSGGGASALTQQIADGAALDQLHHDVRDGLAAHHVLAGVVHRDHRMVVEAGDRLRLAREAGLGDRVLGEIGAEQLDGDGAAEPYVLRGEHLGHAAASQTVRQAVAAVADHSADAPGVGRIRHSAAACFGFGCHQSSPSYLSACVAAACGVRCRPRCSATSRYSLRAARRFRDGPAIKPAAACGHANSMLFL